MMLSETCADPNIPAFTLEWCKLPEDFTGHTWCQKHFIGWLGDDRKTVEPCACPCHGVGEQMRLF